MKNLKKIFYIIILLLFIGVMLMSGTLFLKDKKQDKDEEKVFEELENIIEDTSNNQDNNIKDYSELFNMNKDMIAWIKINGTTLDYPVMQTKDRPNYYLRKNFYKEYSYYGTPYLQENCDINNSDNLIIYGHHINNSKMFGVLESYKNKNFYDEHNVIDFITKDNKYSYKIIYVFKTSATKGFKYYEYCNFEDESRFNTFNNKCKELAFYNTDVSVCYDDKLLTLSTCDYSISNGRIVIVARRI